MSFNKEEEEEEEEEEEKKQAWSQAISVLQNVPHVYSSDPITQHPVTVGTWAYWVVN